MMKRTSQEIIVETFKELLSRKTYGDITVTELLKMSHISRGTFYKYFRDKLAILEFIFQEDVLSKTFFDFTRSIGEREAEYAGFLMENRRFYLHALEVPEFRRLWEEQAAESTYQYLAEKVEDQEWLRFYCRVLGAGFVSVNEAYLKNEIGMTPEEIGQGFQKMSERIIGSGD